MVVQHSPVVNSTRTPVVQPLRLAAASAGCQGAPTLVEALGWADETGSLTPGKSADLVVLPLPDREEPDPHRLVLDSNLPVRAVLFRGDWVQGQV